MSANDQNKPLVEFALGSVADKERSSSIESGLSCGSSHKVQNSSSSIYAYQT